jgi:hypothetical protein
MCSFPKIWGLLFWSKTLISVNFSIIHSFKKMLLSFKSLQFCYWVLNAMPIHTTIIQHTAVRRQEYSTVVENYRY